MCLEQIAVCDLAAGPLLLGNVSQCRPAVKIVKVFLATWTVMLAKIIELWAENRSARCGLEILSHATSLHGAEKEL